MKKCFITLGSSQKSQTGFLTARLILFKRGASELLGNYFIL